MDTTVCASTASGTTSGAQSTTSWRHSALLRTVLSSVLMLLMLASAHLLMVVVNYAEHRVAKPTPAAGSPARMFTDVTLPEEIEAALKKTTKPEEQRALQAASAEVRAGRDLPLRTLPVTPFLAQATMALVGLGMLLMRAQRRKPVLTPVIAVEPAPVQAWAASSPRDGQG